MKLHHVAGVVLVLSLGACAGPQLYQQQLVRLNQGMSPASVVSELQLAPRSSHETVVENIPFSFQHYHLNNGMQRATYLIAYEDGKLKYWGYIDDFRRHPDPRLVQAANNVLSDVMAVR